MLLKEAAYTNPGQVSFLPAVLIEVCLGPALQGQPSVFQIAKVPCTSLSQPASLTAVID